MLPAVNRLRRGEDYRTTTRRGVRAGHPLIVVHLLTAPANHDQPARVGFTVGRSVGGAVVRNAVRRRLRHLMRDRLASLPAGSQLVVRALPAAATVPSGVLAAELDDALSRALGGLVGRVNVRTSPRVGDVSGGRIDGGPAGVAGEPR